MKEFVQGELGAFLLGHTAPDVQVISGQKRSATHFFSVPIPQDALVPWERFFLDYPSLETVADMEAGKAVFIAGYLCHLMADWIWVSEIFEPKFGPQQEWASFSERLYWHNILRAYLDVETFSDLPVDIILEIDFVDARDWLPFIRDQDLENWWSFLREQLEPGKHVKTVEVFAARQGMDVLEFQKMLDSEDELEENIFRHISRTMLENYANVLVEKNIKLISSYLGPGIAPQRTKGIRRTATSDKLDRSSS